ncbi:C13 family peptidase [Leekyejoonella antrihumi]|nr:C13 family peptidase [Leekyejoonella antrihumi]
MPSAGTLPRPDGYGARRTGCRAIGLLLCVAVALGVMTGCSRSRPSAPLRIGVMMPLTGPGAVSAQLPLDWARENVDAAGGVDGRPIQFVYRDLGRQSALTAARAFAADSSIAAVIGPGNSEDALQVAGLFADHHQVMVTPSATSGDLFRAYSADRPQYVWRPVESDIAQMRVMLQVAARDGARSVALVSGDSPYGTTFFDSFGFLATEEGLRVTSTQRYDQEAQNCQGPLRQALSSGADVVLAVPDHASQAICMARAWRAAGSRPRLLFSDAAQSPSLISALGAQAQGLNGIGLAPDPNNGFAAAFRARFHREPTPFAANIYDSVLLIAYGLAGAHGTVGAALAQAISGVVHGTGPATGWDRNGVARTLTAIRAGRLPAINGAVGRWAFDKDSGIDLVASTYEHWRVTGDQFAAAGYLSTADLRTARQGISEADTRATPGKATAALGGTYRPGPKTGTWALLIAASDGWTNYRHQADVLAQYQRLRADRVPASHIIVISDHDLAHNRNNPHQGQVPYAVGDPNLNFQIPIDYPLQGMTAQRLMDILAGHTTPGTPTVIRSGTGDDVYVYLAGHGNQNGVYLGLGQPVPPPDNAYSVLTPALLDQTIAAMAAAHHYRRILVAVDACEGGVLGQHLDAPGALLLSAASPVENSLSTNYDADRQTWLADQFSYQLWKAEAATPTMSIDRLYQHLYLTVTGSHVSAYGPGFGNAATVSLNEFVTGGSVAPPAPTSAGQGAAAH